MGESESILTLILTIIGILVTLIAPIPLSYEYRIFIIIVIIFIFLYIILSRFDKRMEIKEDKIDDLNKRFKTLEDLNNIRLDIREIKK
ncbi:MAG: hypothetical protein AABW67_00995 [Nanoarchaeota archaeon]